MDNKLINAVLTAALALGLVALAPATYAAFNTIPSTSVGAASSSTVGASSSTMSATSPTSPASSTPTSSQNGSASVGMEKCYGVAKAGMNDCDPNPGPLGCTKSIIDSDPNYFLYVPIGLCAKLAGGLSSPTDGASSLKTDIDTNVGTGFGSSDTRINRDTGSDVPQKY